MKQLKFSRPNSTEFKLITEKSYCLEFCPDRRKKKLRMTKCSVNTTVSKVDTIQGIEMQGH